MKINRNGQAEPLTKEQFTKVLNSFQSANHRLIFALSWYTTERPGAILQLTVDQVYTDVGKRKPREVLVIPRRTRKDRKTREVFCHPALANELRAYEPPGAGYLFPGRGFAPLTYRAYYKALNRVFLKLGLTGYSPYSTRRGALTHLLNQGLSTRKIQEVSGHTSLASLQPYLESSEASKKQTVSLL